MSEQRRALITGITGQDGSYLAELLVKKGYEVHGLARRSSRELPPAIEALRLGGLLTIHHGDIRDQSLWERVIEGSLPDEIYNLASQSHIGLSFDCAEETYDTNFLAVKNLLTTTQAYVPQARIVQASSSEMFGDAPAPQTEQTPFSPKNPYAEAKVAAHKLCHHYRDAGLSVACAIMYNHESPRRSKQFVTRKITHTFAKISCGEQAYLSIGNVLATRDWGYAPDYAEALWRMGTHHTADDFIIATGIPHTVQDFINATAAEFGMSLFWSGEGTSMQAFDQMGVCRVIVDSQFFRPTELGSYDPISRDRCYYVQGRCCYLP
jgi:GDPmannose 4,6-dehydratase